MDMAMQELPLAFFTTLAPIGAGTFIALALAFLRADYSDDQFKRIDKMTIIPLILLVIGFAASFFHLANPLHAMGVFGGLGSSPLSNEIAVGVVFLVVAALYWILAMMGKLDGSVRKAFICVVAVLALIFACFIGLAYYVDTIPSWATPAAPISIIGFALAGGSILGTLILSLADSMNGDEMTSVKKALLIMLAVGAVLGIGGASCQFVTAAGIVTAATNGAQMTTAVAGYFAGFLVIFIAGAMIGAYSLIKETKVPVATGAVVAIIVAVFLARLVFYALEISIGL